LVWLLLVMVAVLIVLAIWWWWRQAQQLQMEQRQPSAPRITPAAPTAQLPSERLAALPAPTVPEADDLAAIEGIGPRIHDVLNEAGIKTFAQLADTPVERIREILLAAELHFPADPSSWPAQARLAAESRWQDLKDLKESLKGGA
jgi:predicted flap endonuclease-1-like 5' DNA nuclease